VALNDKNLTTLIDGVAAVAGLLAGELKAEGRVAVEAGWTRFEVQLRAMGEDVPLADLATRFRLNSFELKCVVLALASHIEPRMASLVAQTSREMFARGVTIRLAVERFCVVPTERVTARRSFLPSSPLIRNHILALGRTEVGASEGLL